ncbi:MAG TPA: type VI secretion system tip protein VgrG [Phycisphaerales bacterium]|nr:type VI secretion system tip protein VgrG [Phycisphaerales bacterium]
MASKITQDNRFIAIDTVLGKDVLLLVRFTCREALSRLYEIDAEVTSEKFDIDFDKILGTAVTLKVMRGDNKFRYFSGVVSRFVQTTAPGEHARYEMRIVPWFWLLTRTSDCRLFQNKTVPEVVKAVFDAYPFADFKANLSGEYKPREFQVQYRETDFNFVSRLLEQEGITYYFEHDEKGKHTLNLVDAPTSHPEYAGYEKIDWAGTRGGALDKQVITEWTYEKSVQPAKYATTDFNFKTPSTPLLAPAENAPKHPMKDFEVFDAPGEYEKKADGDEIAKIRLQELQSAQEVASGAGNSRGVCVGNTFTLNHAPRDDWKDKKWLVTEAVHRAVSDPYIAQHAGAQDEFSTRFSIVNAQTLWRPARITPKPTIPGPQTAVVCGPKGNEIHTDEFGRVKVKFHWDRESKADENSSCWIRVSQQWAGKKWGAIMIPRIGQEVIVEFLEGDPDRPIITGRVYNAESEVPYKLPDFATVSTWKSMTSPDGGGFNELRFEDKKGSEVVFLNAQKDLEVRVKHDRHESIENDRHLVVGNDRFEHVKHDQHVKIDNERVEEVAKDYSTKIGGKEMRSVAETLSLKVSKDVAEEFDASASRTVKQKYSVKADEIVLEGGTHVTIKVGGCHVSIDSSGITIAGAKIELESKGDITMKANANISAEATGQMSLKGTGGVAVDTPAQLKLHGSAAELAGDGMVDVKGGLVKIN